MRHFPNPRLAAALIATLALAGCATSGTPAGSTAPSRSTAPSTTQAATPQTPAASSPTQAKPVVDLTFTGAFAFVAKGSAGQCDLGGDPAGGPVLFRFSTSASDYPGLTRFYAFESHNDNAYSVLITLNTSDGDFGGASGSVFAGVIAVSADHHSITLDTDLSPSGAEHVAGTIVCP
ncbi:MAG: hypothetical protein ABI864_06120 [Chloroflexota bacterium]